VLIPQSPEIPTLVLNKSRGGTVMLSGWLDVVKTLVVDVLLAVKISQSLDLPTPVLNRSPGVIVTLIG